MTDKTKSIPLFPGAVTPEGQARINKAAEALNSNAALCRNVLNDVVDCLKNNDCFDSIDYDVRHSVAEALKQWHECSDELLNALSGRNPK